MAKRTSTPRGKKFCLAEKCFVITVDGVKFGPFLDKYRPRIAHLMNHKGISLEPVLIESGWVEFEPPKEARAKKDCSTPLLEGIGFIPVPKGYRTI